jgi:lipoic acid synthetase
MKPDTGTRTNRADNRKPDWLRVRLPSGDAWRQVEDVLARQKLRTVCDEAHCPNKGECWGQGTATFMILGDICTRNCRFCAVAAAKEGRPVEADEGQRIAAAALELGLGYVVITSVDRDDLGDRGAGHFAACVRSLRGAERSESGSGSDAAPLKIETLIPDYRGAELEALAAAGPDVIAHNVETVRSLQYVRDSRAGFDQSLAALAEAKRLGAPLTKSSLLLGLGEKTREILSAMDELREAGVDILVMGQYLRPSAKQIPVAEYLRPEAFARLAEEGRKRGFKTVISSPLARTSYHAREGQERARAGHAD